MLLVTWYLHCWLFNFRLTSSCILHCWFFNFRLTSSCILSIDKLREINHSKTPSEHAFGDTRLIGNALLTSFLFYTLSVWEPTPGDYKFGNALLTSFLFYTLSVWEPTPGDYKFAKPNRTHFHWLAHYQRSCVAGLCNWINPSPIVTMVIKMKEVRRLCEWYVLQSTAIHRFRDRVKSCIITHAWPCIIYRETWFQFG